LNVPTVLHLESI